MKIINYPLLLSIALLVTFQSCTCTSDKKQPKSDPSEYKAKDTSEIVAANENLVVVNEDSVENVKKEEPKERPPLEIFVFDQKEMPNDIGIAGKTYTAAIYILDNVKKQKFGPFKGSSYPNSKESPLGSDRPNSVESVIHLFNNKNGHKGGTAKGLNLIDVEKKRFTPGYSWTHKSTTLQYANVHSGQSDNGNYNSRGSLGCITVHPGEVDQFWSHFDFSTPRNLNENPKVFTSGNSIGTIYVSRTDEATRLQLIQEIEKMYE